MYCGAEISDIVPFTCLLKYSNNELRKMYEFFYKYFKIPDALFVLGCDKATSVLKFTGFPD
jgi:hypothetical protein